MNKSKRLEILELLIEQNEEYTLAEGYLLQYSFDTGTWTAWDNFTVNRQLLCQHEDIAECYEQAMAIIRRSKMTAESLYTTKLENVVKKLAGTDESLSSAQHKSLIKSAQRALKAKPKEN